MEPQVGTVHAMVKAQLFIIIAVFNGQLTGEIHFEVRTDNILIYSKGRLYLFMFTFILLVVTLGIAMTSGLRQPSQTNFHIQTY